MTTWSRRLPHVSIVVLVALVALANQFAGDAQGPGDGRTARSGGLQ
jgi:hypothetical protein